MNLRLLPLSRMLSAFSCATLLTAGCTDSDTEQPKYVAEPLAAIELERVDKTQIDISLAAYDADAMAYYIVEAESEVIDASRVFAEGISAEASHRPVVFTIDGLTPDTHYTVFAAASKGDVYGKVVSIDVTTSEHAVSELITGVTVSGLNVSYNVDLAGHDVCFHTYIEKWFYDYELFIAMQVAGPGLDIDSFVRNMIADYGVECKTSGRIIWTAGEDHPIRNTVSLTPGKEYYVIAGTLDNDAWSDDSPSVVPFKMPEPNGMSQHDIDLIVTDITNDSVTMRMECDQTKVAFFFWDLFPKQKFDEFKAEKGDYGMMDFLFEYNNGNVSANTYTDKRAVSAGESYMLAVYGIDYDGCEIYKELQIDVPGYTPSLSLYAMPYQRELQGYHDYDTFLMTLEPKHFSGELNVDNIYCSVIPIERSTFDAYMGYIGLEGQDLTQIEAAFAQQPDMLMQLSYMLHIYPVYSDDAAVASLQKEGYFERIFSDLDPATEYVFVAMAVDGQTSVVRVASATTEARPEPEAASDAYNAYLGEWTLMGKSTADWLTYETYDLRIEELTPNRSFKVYGWSHSWLSNDYPFEMRYHPETGKVSVDGPQVLGTTMVDDKQMEILFFGKMHMGYDDLVILLGYNGPLYTGYVRDDHLTMFSEILSVNGYNKEFMAMNYLLRNGDNYYKVEDDGYDLVYFRIDRPTEAAASPAGISPLRASSVRARTMRYGADASSYVLPVAPLSNLGTAAASHVHAELQGVAKFE